jgi:hypothetical protein
MSLREECDRLASQLSAAHETLRERDRQLRKANERIQLLEQRLACRGERLLPTGECPRCAQVAHSLVLVQARQREREEYVVELEREKAQLEARVVTQEKRITELEKKRHPSAAPFRQAAQKRQPHPKPSGAKKGHRGNHRSVPPNVPIEEVEAQLCGCPRCGRPVKEVHRLEQIVVEIPPVRPIYRKVVTYSGVCEEHGRVRSTHPFQVSAAMGAAGVHLGPNAQALAVDLRHGHGLTTRRVCRILAEHFQLPLTQGGLCHLLARTAQRLRPDYTQLQHDVQQSPSVHSDETSWWVDGATASLWVLTTPQATLYHISRHRDTATLQGILGARYDGTLVSDCAVIYDRYDAAHKSKCVSHHNRAIAEAQQKVAGSRFLAQLYRLMGAALKLQRWSGRLPAAVYQRGVESLEQRLTKLLEPRYAEHEEERIANRFRRRREHIFTFLHQPEVAATNNLAERQLRPAVITRKLSCGNKTDPGARTWEVLGSLAATCRQRGESFVAFVASRLSPAGDTALDPKAPRPAPGHG